MQTGWRPFTDGQLTFTARLPTGIVSRSRDGLVRRRMRFGRRVDADIRIYVQEVRAVHTAATDGGVRAAIRLPGMQRACAPCSPDRAKLPHHVRRRASGRRKIRARHRRIARRGKIARARMQLLRRWGFQDGETRQGETVSASLTDRASRDPANFPQASSCGQRGRPGTALQHCPMAALLEPADAAGQTRFGRFGPRADINRCTNGIERLKRLVRYCRGYLGPSACVVPLNRP
jgi:hypothetical protein